MSRRYFGTDGIRGKANVAPMTADVALRVGMAAGLHFRGGNHDHRAVIGKDTRLSCYMFENALAAGFVSVGMEVLLLGPIPTPGVATLTRSMRADLGVMISASHNPFEDNGIKLFGPDGYKLSDEEEHAIEDLMDADLVEERVTDSRLGRVRRLQGALGRYSEFCKSAYPRNRRLDGLRIVVDAANGAGYRVAPEALWELGAEVIPIGVDPNGTNINKACGSTAPEAMQRAVCAHGAHLGIALDGDADRVIVADETGHIVDGDQIMALVGVWLNEHGNLRGGGIVGTVMSNLGFQRLLESKGLVLERTRVGDRYVVERMREKGFNMGGEQSGHVIFSDHSTTGDGLIGALQVLAVLVERERPMSELGRQFERVPQLLRNVHFEGGQPLEEDSVKSALSAAEVRLGNDGRLVVRKSGTEPLIRIMAEHGDSELLDTVVSELEETIRKAVA
ncbi:MAG: phosphoglucosamine mutase [Rhodospirillales bacterium]|nr:phosphoglucosamine mutase [Rhodospirillales bacterium]